MRASCWRNWASEAPGSRGRRGIRILTFTTLYPSAAQPQHGVFVENRLRDLQAEGSAKGLVMAPVPWFPFRHAAFGRYARHAAAPARETRFGIEIVHPRYFLLPGLGMSVAPFSLFLSARAALLRLQREGLEFDLIDAHYFYPDGVTAAMLGAVFNKPVCITGRGTDLNQIPAFLLPQRQILWAARRAAGLITVCQSLKEKLIDLGIESDKVTVLRNGVDLDHFQPRCRDMARRSFDVSGSVLLSVGALIPRKGHDLVIRAMVELPGCTLLVAGTGPERAALDELVRTLGLGDRVRFLGQVTQDRLPELYSAADALVLASSSEGWANVLLEAMACGTPAIATNVSGTPEVVTSPDAGILIDDRTPAGIVQAALTLLGCPPDRLQTRAHAERFDWGATTRGQLDLFAAILRRVPPASSDALTSQAAH